MTQWYYTNGRSKHGPIDEEGVRLRVEKGYITPATLLWHDGLDGWKKAAELGFAGGSPDIATVPSARPIPEAAPTPAAAAVSAAAPAPAPAQPSINVSVNASANGGDTTVSVGNWLLTFIVMAIPLVNLIMVLVWAFGGGSSKSKSNWARAILLFAVILILLWLLLLAAGVGAFVRAIR